MEDSKMNKTFSETVANDFSRQVASLMKYMNAYSITLRDSGIIKEEQFSELYDALCKVNDENIKRAEKK